MNLDNHGIRKAAILVDCLDQPTADRLLEQIDAPQAQLVRQAMVDLGQIDPADQRRVIDEFLRIGPMVPQKEPPGIDLDQPGDCPDFRAGDCPDFRAAKMGLSPSDPPRGLSQFSRSENGTVPLPPNPSDPPFRNLRQAQADKLVRVLVAERPQTIALVLSHLPPEQAGSVLARLSPRLQADVIRRLVDLEETSPEILREVERAIESRLSDHIQVQRRRVAGLSAVASILEAAGGRTGMEILENLAAHDRGLADKLGPEPLAFDELVRLDETALAAVLRAAKRPLVILALVGAAPELAEHCLARMSEPEAALVRRELEHLGPTRLGDVSEARRRIAALARRMAAQGQINWPTPGRAASSFSQTLQPAA